MNLELLVGATLILTILECIFWGVVVWSLFKKQVKRLGPYVGDGKQ